QVSSSATCPGGAWAIGTLASSSPSPTSYSTTNGDVGTQLYYAFACDSQNVCSASSAGTFTVQNRVPSIVSASVSPDPGTPGGIITFSLGWNDPGDGVKAVICKTDSVSAGTCPG